MSHGLEKRESYHGWSDSRSPECTNLHPVDEWEMPVSEGEIPRDSHDEAVIEEDREDVEPDHTEDDQRTPC
ncbi:hypothetical protein GCM10027514_03490 [Azotobacter armeniacus]